MNFRFRLEKYFFKLAVICYRHRIKVLALILMVFLALASQTGRIAFDTSTESFFRKDDPVMVNYHHFREQFGRDDIIIVAVKSPQIFTAAALETIKSLHLEIEEKVPFIEDITSILNVRDIRGEKDELVVDDLLSEIPRAGREMASFKERVLSNPFYENMFISGDGKLAMIVIRPMTWAGDFTDDELIAGFDMDAEGGIEDPHRSQHQYLSDAQVTRLTDVLDGIVQKYNAPDFEIYQAGSPIVDVAVKNIATREMALFSSLSLLTISLFLYLMFRRISGVALPVAVVFLSMISMLGLMALFHTPLTMVTQILSSFILVVGVGDSVHILTIFYRQLDETDNKETAIARALEHSGLAVGMTSLTTAGGLLSFTAAEIKPVGDLGVFGACGVGLAFIFTVFLLPAVISLIPIKPKKMKTGKREIIDGVLKKIAAVSIRHAIMIVCVTAVLCAGSIYVMTDLRFTHNILDMLPDGLPVKKATKMMDRDLKGTVTLEVVLDTGKENGLYDPGLLADLERSVKTIEGMAYGNVFAGKAWTVTSILKEIHQALNENKKEFYAVPQERDLVAQEFLLFENSGADDLEDVVDSRFSLTRFTIKAPFENAMEYGPFIEMVQKHFKENYKGVEIAVTGIMALFTETMYNVMKSTTRSYVIAFTVISILMFVFIPHPLAAALSLFPNLMPILLILGFMGVAGIDLDSTNMMIGSIILGLVVDDTIHFMHNFIRYYQRTGDVFSSVSETLLTAGRAILVTSMVLSCGFFIYMMSSMKNIVNFGLLAGVAILFALLADFFLAPALLSLAAGKLK